MDETGPMGTLPSNDPPAPAPEPSAPAVDVSAMIGEAVSGNGAAPAPTGTALDALASDLAGDPAPGGESAAPADSSRPRGAGRDYAAEYARRRDPNAPPARRGRPPRDPGASATVVVNGAKPGSKAELALRVEELERDNARLLAVADTGAVDRLSTSFQVLAKLLFSLPAASRGPHWPLTEAEAKNIGDASAHAAAPYAEQIEKELPWIAPVIAIGTAFGSRLMQDAEIRKRREAPGFVHDGPAPSRE